LFIWLIAFLLTAGCDNSTNAPNTIADSPADNLRDAASDGDVADVKRLLGEGVPINAMGQRKRAPLHLAVHNGHRQTVAVLLENGANPDVRSNDATRNDSATSERGPTPLHLAIYGEQLGIAKLLLNAGANADACTDYDEVMGRDKLDQLTFYGSRFQVSPLILAVMRDSTDAVDLLIRNGATVDPDLLRDKPRGVQSLARHKRQRDPESMPPNPLVHAVINDRLKSAQRLVHHGAELRPFFLLKAVEYGHDDVVTWVLDEGVDVNYSEKWLVMSERPSIEGGKGGGGFITPDCSAIDLAFEYRDKDLMRELLKQGAKADGVLHEAASAGDISTIRILLDHGVNLTERKTDGLTPLQVAADRGHRECVEVLKTATE
jgi:ankyrin repeat protein